MTCEFGAIATRASKRTNSWKTRILGAAGLRAGYMCGPLNHCSRLIVSSFAALLLFVQTGCGVEVGPSGPYPRTVYTDLRTEVIFDGERISVEGTTLCRRNSNYDSHGDLRGWVDVGGPLYDCGPEWIAKRLPDGSALMVGAYVDTGTWESFPPDLTHYEQELTEVPRAVIWLGDAENPTRGEYYFSSIALEDPASRLQSVKSEILEVRDFFDPERQASDPLKVVPWFPKARQHREKYLVAYFSVTVPRDLWSQVPGLEDALSAYSETTLFSYSKEIPRAFRGKLISVMKPVKEHMHPYQWVPLRRGTGNGSVYEHGYHQSLRIRPMEWGADGVLREVVPYPKGVLPLTIRTQPPARENGSIELGGHTLSHNREEIWPDYSAGYDPGTGTLHLYDVIGFSM